MIHSTRMRTLKKSPLPRGEYVLYWLQAAQRVQYNHALEHAIDLANEHGIPLVVFFGITNNYPSANERHYRFMLQGLREVKTNLAERGIRLVARNTEPVAGAARMAERARLLVADRGYLRHQKSWRLNLACLVECPVVEVETDVVVPVEEVSRKEEYAARTIRPKIRKLLPDYLLPLKQRCLDVESIDMEFEDFEIDNLNKALQRLDIDRDVGPVEDFPGGATEACRRLREFIDTKMTRYAELRNDPNADVLSGISPYLHFGQISPLQIAMAVSEHGGAGADAYLEELIVRRELSMNFVNCNPDYDSYKCLPDWAARTLETHRKDKREYMYSRQEMEVAGTHDPYWNAAQREMILTGKMHGYMRMYWGKKIIEWSGSPEEAFETALYLNDKYELDGRDPNGYAGVAWCFGKHDRPWAERAVFGTVRYMNDKGLKRKFDADAYVRRIDRLCDSGAA